LVFARRNSASKCILYWIFTENNALRLLTNIRKYQRFGYYDATLAALILSSCSQSFALAENAINKLSKKIIFFIIYS